MMKYKIGDKVRLTNTWGVPAVKGGICTIIAFGTEFPYRIRLDIDTTWECLVYDSEIEAFILIGQQLTFDFMKE